MEMSQLGDGWYVSASCRLPKNEVGASIADGRHAEGSVLLYLYDDVGRRWQYRKQKWGRNRPPCGNVMGKGMFLSNCGRGPK